MFWLQDYFADNDLMCFFEIDDSGWVSRQVELSGPHGTPVTAAALAEWPDPHRDGREAIRAYMAKYGSLADQPFSEFAEDFPGIEISREAFEDVWARARAYLEARSA